jgi:hypothetical protein
MKDLSDEQVSQAIAALMGICWHHDYHADTLNRIIACIKCGNNYEIHGNDQFTAHTPDGIWRWKSYMEREMAEEWEDYLDNMAHETISVISRLQGLQDIVYSETLNSMLNPLNLVQYLYDNLDGWGYEECAKRTKNDVIDCYYDTNCDFIMNCHGTGKVLTEKARKFKTIVEGEGE